MRPTRTPYWQEALSSHKEVVMKLRLFTLSALAAGLLLGTAAQGQENDQQRAQASVHHRNHHVLLYRGCAAHTARASVVE